MLHHSIEKCSKEAYILVHREFSDQDIAMSTVNNFIHTYDTETLGGNATATKMQYYFLWKGYTKCLGLNRKVSCLFLMQIIQQTLLNSCGIVPLRDVSYKA